MNDERIDTQRVTLHEALAPAQDAPRRITAGEPSLHGNETRYVIDAIVSGWLTMGKYVAQFEAAFASYLGVKHAIAVSNGTSALHLALLACDIGKGDEVIVPACTFIATANAVAYTGATPVIVDIDPDTWCMSVTAMRRAITDRTKAIVPVHVYGVPADIETINRIADDHGLWVIEDAAEALGAKVGTELVGMGVGMHYAGTCGDVSAFSFYGNKTITTGEGGMVVTDNDVLANKIRLLRGQGQRPGSRYWHDIIGFNYRMTDLQAAVGCAQMEQLDGILARRRAVIKAYQECCDPEWDFQRCDGEHGAWAFAVRLPISASQASAHLATLAIETRPVFPPIHWQAPYLNLVPRPFAEHLHEYGLVLPTHAEMTPEQARFVMHKLKAYVKDVLNGKA